MGKKVLSTDRQEEIGILSRVRARLAQSYAALEGRPADAGAVPVEAAPPGQTALFNAFRGRARVREVRREDGADGLVLRVPRLRD